MFAWLEKYGITTYAGKLIRKLLAILGGYLIAKWGLDGDLVASFIDHTTELILALLPIIISQVWSMKKTGEQLNVK